MLTPPERPDSPLTTAALACNQCDHSFTRPSHLNRHRLTHLPRSRRNVIPCLRCSRTFSRQDVLLRHLRATHHLDTTTKNSCQRSCDRCVRKKLKCDRELPCRSCSAASAAESCSYPSAAGKTSGPGAEAQPASQTAAATDDDHTSATPQSRDDSSPGPYGADFAKAPAASLPGLVQSLEPRLLQSDEYNLASAVFLDGSTAVDGNPAMFGPSLAVGIGGGQLDFRGSAFNWLDFDVPDVELAMNCIDVDVGANVGVSVYAPVAASSLPGVAPGDSTSPLATLPPRPVVLPWPFEQGQETTQETAPARYSLPPLCEVLQDSLRSSSGTKTAALESLVRLLSDQRLPGPDEFADGNASLGLDLLKKLLDVYFSDFQITQPIFHTPTWSMADSPTMLLAAMACIGAVLSSEPNAAELASSISDFCAPMIIWLGASDGVNYSNASYLASLCLHQIYSLGSGNPQLYQNADRMRGVLIGSLRGLGLLTSRPSPQEDANATRSPPTEPATLRAEWIAWTVRERDKRIAWASFEYDCSLCTLSSRRGAVDLSELPSRLPCADSLWEAPSAHAWAALRSRLPPGSLGASLSSVISGAIAGKPVPEHVSWWGKRLCGQVIGRLLWDLKQLETISTSEHFGLPSLFSGHQQSKLSLLQGLGSLVESMDHPISTANLVSYNISSLLYHYSRLYTADDIMDTVLYIVRSVVSGGASRRDRGVDLARQRLASALGADPPRARKLAWHAGQIIAVANEYLVSAPCEILRLFMGYVFVVAFARYFPRTARGRAPRTAAAASVRLSLTCRDGDDARQRAAAVAEWIQLGGPASIGSAEDIFADGATAVITQDAQNMLYRLRSWGLAEKFSKILHSFENIEGSIG